MSFSLLHKLFVLQLLCIIHVESILQTSVGIKTFHDSQCRHRMCILYMYTFVTCILNVHNLITCLHVICDCVDKKGTVRRLPFVVR